MIETIRTDEGEILCIIVRSAYAPAVTTFLTPPDYKQQVGFVVYPAGGEVSATSHIDLERHLTGTSEVVLVKKGACVLDVYTCEGRLVCSPRLGEGDLALMVGGGHGFRMLEDTMLLEVQQGPYTGLEEKRLF